MVLSGSLPPGLPARTYATLIEPRPRRRARGAGHARGGAAAGRGRGPAIVKPNLAELAALAGAPLADAAAEATVAAAAERAAGRGRGAVVVSLGPDGLLAVTGDGRWRARPPAAVAGNATGAGDAVAAALAHGLVLGRPGTSGCGTRWRSAPRPPRRRWPGSSARPGLRQAR